jgi:hypothetical protein
VVGDSDVDIATAKGAAVPSIPVSFGYAREALGELIPDAVIGHFDELVPSATSILGASLGDAGPASCTRARHRFAQFRPDCSQREATVESHFTRL